MLNFWLKQTFIKRKRMLFDLSEQGNIIFPWSEHFFLFKTRENNWKQGWYIVAWTFIMIPKHLAFYGTRSLFSWVGRFMILPPYTILLIYCCCCYCWFWFNECKKSSLFYTSSSTKLINNSSRKRKKRKIWKNIIFLKAAIQLVK